MIKAKDAVVWVNFDERKVAVRPRSYWGREDLGGGHWCDPIGAHYSQWHQMSKRLRAQFMLETVIDLAMKDIPVPTILKAFAEIDEFYDLGRQSYPMCRALTMVLLGKCLEPNNRTFDQLMEHYR